MMQLFERAARGTIRILAHCGYERCMFLAIALCLASAASPRAAADETDQFLLPPRDTFEDIGPYLSLTHYRVIEDVVNRVNRNIERAVRLPDESQRRARLATLHASTVLADGVRERFGPGFVEMRVVENALRTPKAQKAFGDAVVAYRSPTWIYFHTHLPFDPRRLPLMFQSSTFQAYDVFFGTDKLAHFHDLGHIYYRNYISLRREGHDTDEATRLVVHLFSDGAISEGAIIGLFATGVISNADLASNYIGMKFYQNLTRPITIGDHELPPMVVRIGDFWALNRHVRPDSDFLKPFITNHWNEALNPNWYEWGMRGPILRQLRENADDILTFYADDVGRPRDRAFFEQKAKELSTFFGEDYGHSGFGDGIIGIAEGCFPDESEATVTDDSHKPIS